MIPPPGQSCCLLTQRSRLIARSALVIAALLLCMNVGLQFATRVAPGLARGVGVGVNLVGDFAPTSRTTAARQDDATRDDDTDAAGTEGAASDGNASDTEAAQDGTSDSANDQTLPDRAPPRIGQAVPAFRQANTVAVLKVEGVIDNITLHSLERRVEKARRNGADAILLDLNTPGGALDAALDICHLLKNDAPSNTVAWVNPKAYSAGTIIGLACREIVVAPNSTMGDAAVIQAMPGMGLVPIPEAERAKLESPLLQEVVDSARRNGYDENLVQSFISVGVELWMLENKTTGQRVFVDRAEYEEVFGGAPPKVLTSVAPQGRARTVQPKYTPKRADGTGGQAVSAQEQDELDYAQSRPPNRLRLTSDDRADWVLIKQVISNDRILTIAEDEAVAYGLAQAIIGNEQQIRQYFGASNVVYYDGVWSEGLVRFMSSMWVRIILIIVFVLAMFIELAAPGTGVFGITAVIALLLLAGTPYLIGAANWWPMALIALGLLLLAVEIFVIPGFGVSGIGGALAVFAGLVGTFVSSDLGTEAGQEELLTGLIATMAALFFSGIGLWLITRYTHSIPMLDRFVLSADVGAGEAAASSTTAAGLLASMTKAPDPTAVNVGDVGVSLSPLRPSGRALFGERSVEANAVVGYIDENKPIRAIRVTPFGVEVEEIRS